MAKRWPVKDPAESITVEFSFRRVTLDITLLGIEIRALRGVDETPDNLKSGQPTVGGGRVLQRIVGGVEGVTYGFEATVRNNSTGDILIVAAHLPVRDKMTTGCVC